MYSRVPDSSLCVVVGSEMYMVSSTPVVNAVIRERTKHRMCAVVICLFSGLVR